MSEASRTSLHIGFILVPGMLSTGTALPYEMWRAARDHRRAARTPWPGCALHLVAAGARERSDPLGFTAEHDLDDCPRLDLVYLPALWRHPLRSVRANPRLGPWLRERAASGTQFAAASTGVALLAASGLLDARPATTHWYCFDQLARAFPRVLFKRDYFITQSGTLHCAASINSLADVTVYLVERFFDRATALHVERNFSHEIRRSYTEHRYLDGENASPLTDEIVVEAQTWIADNLARPLTIADLASEVGVGVRTLERRFRAATGSSPRAWWQLQRLLSAKELLEKTNLGIADIAWRVGFEDAGYFTRSFQRQLLVTPSAYRRTVRAKLFQAAPARR